MEGPYHLSARKRVYDLGVRFASPLGYVIEGESAYSERQFHRIIDGVYYQWSFDLVFAHVCCNRCKFEDERVDVEFDTPGAGHGTRITNAKNALKDRAAEAEGYKVVRLNTYHITGFTGKVKGVRYRSKITPSPDEDILAELALERMKMNELAMALH